MNKTEQFIERMRAIHGDRYDYSLVDYVNARTKVKIICSVHGVFEQVPDKHRLGAGCQECGAKKLSRDDFISKSKEVHGDFYDYSLSDFVSTKKKVTIICPEHGEFQQLPSVHMRGNGCIKCGRKSRAEKIRVSPEEFLRRCKESHGDFYDYSLVEYVGANDTVKIICPEHGIFEQRPSSHMGGVGCAKCGFDRAASMRALTREEVISRFKETHGDKYDYSLVEYTGTTSKVTIICPTHGKFDQGVGNHMKGNGCSKCHYDQYSKKLTLTTEEFREKAKDVHGTKYDYSLAEYLSSQTAVTISCPEHGEFIQSPSNHLRGSGCPECIGFGPSKGELEIASFIESLGIPFEQSNRSIISPKELDIFIPDHNIAIEFNGIYWHSEKFQRNDYHQEKSLLCMEKGIQLIHVWEDDWYNVIKRNIIKNKIKSKLGFSEKVYARKCDVEDNLSVKEVKDFLIKNHIQGYVTSKYIGLRHNGELVAVLGMKKTKDEGIYDLTRFASSKSVVGGFSKLLSYWKKNNEWSKIITYAHLDYSHGNLYRVNGFTFDGYTRPNYSYTYMGKVRESRQTYMKHKLKDRLKDYDPTLTEKENMSNNGYLRVYDSGSMRFYMENV